MKFFKKAATVAAVAVASTAMMLTGVTPAQAALQGGFNLTFANLELGIRAYPSYGGGIGGDATNTVSSTVTYYLCDAPTSFASTRTTEAGPNQPYSVITDQLTAGSCAEVTTLDPQLDGGLGPLITQFYKTNGQFGMIPKHPYLTFVAHQSSTAGFDYTVDAIAATATLRQMTGEPSLVLVGNTFTATDATYIDAVGAGLGTWPTQGYYVACDTAPSAGMSVRDLDTWYDQSDTPLAGCKTIYSDLIFDGEGGWYGTRWTNPAFDYTSTYYTELPVNELDPKVPADLTGKYIVWVNEGAPYLSWTGGVQMPSAATVPSVPQNVAIDWSVYNYIALKWDVPADNGGSPILGYNIYLDRVQIDTTTLLGYGFTSLLKNTTYDLKVSAFNAIGEGPKYSLIHVTPVPAFTVAPTHPHATVGQNYSEDPGIDWTGLIGNDIKGFTAISGLPDGITFDYGCNEGCGGSFSGTPTVAGTYTVTIQLELNDGTKLTKTTEIIVDAASGAIDAPGAGTHTPSAGKQTLTWGTVTGATGYKVKVNGKVVATVSGGSTNTYAYNGILGPKDVVEVITLGNDSVESAPTALTYVKQQRIALGTIRFLPNSPVLLEKSKKELRTFARRVAAHGFTQVVAEGYTKYIKQYSDGFRLILSRQRAASTAAFLKSEFKKLGVEVTITGIGRGTSNKRTSDVSTR